MPLENLIKAGIKMKKAYDEGVRGPVAKSPDPEIPVPGRVSAGTKGPMSNKAAVNRAADVLNVPGKDVVRGAMAKRKKMLDEL